MFELLTLSQFIVVIGFLMLITAVIIGVEAGIELLFIGSILIIGGLVGSLTGNYYLMLIICAALGFFYIFFGHSYIKSRLHTTLTPTNTSRLIGATGIVIKPITPSKPGRVKVDDEEWRATAKTKFKSDDKVRVVSFSGTTLKVTKL